MFTMQELVRLQRTPIVSEYYWGKIGVLVGWIKELNLYQINIEGLNIVVSPFAFTVLNDY